MNSVTVMWVFAFLVCVSGAVSAARRVVNGYRSEGWPTATGEVVEAFARNRFGRYEPVIRYRYQYGDAQFNGATLAYARVLVPSKSSVNAFLKQFQPGQQISLRVRPDRPSVSVLRPGNRFQNWIEAAAAGALGLYILFRLFAA